MQEFPSNSHKSKSRAEMPSPRPEKIERITSAEAIPKKRSLGKQFKHTFIGGSARMALDYMMLEVVIPAIQNTMIDAFQGGIERLIKGETRRRGVKSSVPNTGHVDYQSQSMSRVRPPAPRPLSQQSRARQTFNELVIPTRPEAEEVLDRMYDLLSRYGTVTLGDLYEMTGIESKHTDYKWGWTQLRGTRPIRQNNGGYLLDLPEPESLG